VLQVFQSDPAGQLTPIACDDDGGIGLTSRVGLRVEAGVMYKIAVCSHRSSQGGKAVVVFQVCPGCVTTPLTDTNPLGTTHNFSTQVVDNMCVPVSGLDMQFEVTAGPNSGTSQGTILDFFTDAMGVASLSYEDTFGSGTDSILVSTDHGLPSVSCTATKIWCNPSDVFTLRNDRAGYRLMICDEDNQYRFTNPIGGGITYCGPLTITRSATRISGQSVSGDPNRLTFTIDLSTGRGTARYEVPVGGTILSITDLNINNNPPPTEFGNCMIP
jgi:hypothetical protein